jgi:hypothetical protein
MMQLLGMGIVSWRLGRNLTYNIKSFQTDLEQPRRDGAILDKSRGGFDMFRLPNSRAGVGIPPESTI